MRLNFVFRDWVNSNEESIYSTKKGVELSLGDFHSGTTFVGELYLDSENEAELRQALMDGYHPLFAIHDEAVATYQVQNIRELIGKLRDSNTLIPCEMKKELKAGNVSVLADILECALEVK